MAKQNLLTAAEVDGIDGFPLFKNDKERIKYITKAYKNFNLAKSFEIFYGLTLDKEVSKKYAKTMSIVENIVIGNVYLGTVEEFKKNVLTFTLQGIKEEIICKENFNNNLEAINNYLLTHDNKLLFEVREKKNNKYYVSVINAYYKVWVNNINHAIKYNIPLNVHIDSLVRGGYMCHTQIAPLVELTGSNYTHLVFIPGSQIVLNIEHDFESWIGQDVDIIPQNFVDYYKNFKTGEVEKSLVGSRKKILNIQGMNNLADLYSKYLLTQKSTVKIPDMKFTGTITGVINSRETTGVFVEIDDLYITGLLPIDPMDLLDYKSGDHIEIKIDKFDIQEGQDPFIYNRQGKVIKSNTRVIFKL